MRNKYLLLFLLFLIQFQLNAQDFQWVRQIKGINHEYKEEVIDIAVDTNQNSYTIGDTRSSYFDLDPTPDGELIIDNSNIQNFSGTYLFKLDAAGNFIWGHTFGNLKTGDHALKVKIGTDGNIYAILSISELNTNLNIIENFIKIFKISPSGNILSTISIPQFYGYSNSITPFDIELDNENNIYVTGYFIGNVNINNNPNFNLNNNNGIGNFVFKINNDGNLIWSKQININFGIKNKLALRPDGNINLCIDNSNNYHLINIDTNDGATIWFKDLKTNLQYEMHGHAPIINKIKNIYYVTTENAVYQIENPTKLKKSDKNYNLEKILHDKFYYKEGSFSTLGAKTLIEFDYDEFSDDNTQILTSFVSNDSLFHIYKDSISTKVGFIENQNFIQTHEFSKDIKPLQFYYDWRMPIVNEKQIIQFMTKNEGEFGFIEIKNGKIEIKKFINSNKAPKMSSKDMMDWFKNTFNVYYVGFESLKLKDIDEIEKYIKAVDLAQNRKIDHYLLDNLDKNTIETPRIYSKIELPNHKLYTSYYYKKNNKEIILIQFEWKMDKPNQSFEDYINTKFQSNSINKNRFNELNKYLDNYIGKPINHEKSEYRETIT